jgi:hypothetical protein
MTGERRCPRDGSCFHPGGCSSSLCPGARNRRPAYGSMPSMVGTGRINALADGDCGECNPPDGDHRAGSLKSKTRGACPERRDGMLPDLTCAYSEFHHSHRWDHPVLAEKNRTAVQGAILLTFAGDEHDSTGRNIVLACWNKSNHRHIGGDINFLFAAFIGHCHSLTVHALNGISDRRICHHA